MPSLYSEGGHYIDCIYGTMCNSFNSYLQAFREMYSYEQEKIY